MKLNKFKVCRQELADVRNRILSADSKLTKSSQRDCSTVTRGCFKDRKAYVDDMPDFSTQFHVRTVEDLVRD